MNSSIENRLIFLISMPRSGSTLLQRVLDGIPEIETTGEPWVLLPLLSMYDDSVRNIYGQEFSIKAKDEFLKELNLSSDVLVSAQKAYADTIYKKVLECKGSQYFLDKTPRYIYVLDNLVRLYPKAKFIVLLRDPRDIVSSYATTWREGDFNKVLEDEYYCNDFSLGFEKLANFVSNNSSAHVVRYENLLDSPDSEINKICDYLGLNFDKKLKHYGENKPATAYAFGDPKNAFKKTTISKNKKLKWLDSIDNQADFDAYKKCLSLIPSKSIAELGYSSCDNEAMIKLIKNIHKKTNKHNKKVYIATPSFNSQATIERTIRSVLNLKIKSGYTVHYHIQDGASNDSTLDIVKKYYRKVQKNFFNYPSLVFTYSSEKDTGMYDALSRAFRSFEIKDSKAWMAWINSDDFLSTNVLEYLEKIDSLDRDVNWLTGKISNFSEDYVFTEGVRGHFSEAIAGGLAEGIHMCFIQQEGTFWKKVLWDSVGGDTAFEGFKLAGDWNLWRLFAKREKIYVSSESLGYFCRRKGQISQVSILDYYAEIDRTVPRKERTKLLKQLDSENTNSYLIEFSADKCDVKDLSVSSLINEWKKKNELS